MGIFGFMFGTLCGVYIAQNYTLPKIEDWAQSKYVKARELEKAYRNKNFDPNEAHKDSNPTKPGP
ncbi:hypothetical protein P3L10_003220 [Capsicum annuum]